MNFILQLNRTSMRFDDVLSKWGGSLLGLVLRIYVGWQFLKAGFVKISDWEGTLSLFTDEYKVPVLPPELAAYMGAGGELVFPVLLIIGFFSRPAALGLFFVNLMAVISYPALFTFECPAAINDHKYWGLLLLVLVFYGPGKLTLDNFLKKPAM